MNYYLWIFLAVLNLHFAISGFQNDYPSWIIALNIVAVLLSVHKIFKESK